MNNVKNLVVPLLSLIAALAIIGGAAYAYEKEAAKSHQADQLISSVQDQFRQKTAAEQRQADLAQARSSLQIASARLAELRAGFSPVAAIEDAYASFAQNAATLTAAAAKISGPAAAKIAAAEQGLADTLQAWNILLSSIPPSGPSPSQIAQAQNYADQAQGFIDQIKTVADDLTSSNSGLTQSQIDTYQKVVDTTAGTADKTTGDLAVALPPPPPDTSNPDTNQDTGSTPPADNTASPNDTSGSTSPTSGSSGTDTSGQTNTNGGSDSSGQTGNQGGPGGSPTAGDIAEQQQVVDQLQQQVDQLQQQASSTPQDGGTTAPPGTLDIPPPPIQFDIYGRPKLIQGSNSDVYHP